MAAAYGFDPITFHARYRPQALACVDLTSGERLTYSEFDNRATQAAMALARMPTCKRGDRIVTLGRNSAEQAILVAACERAGLVFTPLNWRLAAAELATLLADAEPAIIIADDEFRSLAIETIDLAGAKGLLANPSVFTDPRGKPQKPKALRPLRMKDPCIILYTSGTTGKPKGVVITRENAWWSSLNFAAVAMVKPGDVLLCDAPMFHTVGLVAITRTALMQGATVLMSDRFVPGMTLKRLVDPELKATHYFVVPQMVEALLREPGFATADLSRLTALFSGGGPLNAELVAGCLKRGVKLINGYGMSETGSNIHMPLDADYMSRNSHAVGFPAPYLEVKLARADGEPVAHGEVGEVWMRGPSVSPGYWRQPDATATSFIGDWFRSGDLARQQEDGAYVIVGRLKDMYISGGENVYPAEVELVLKAVAGVTDAAVVGVPDARWGEAGCAFIESSASADALLPVLRERCAASLARFKQPAHFRFVASLPRGGSGKVLKAELRAHFAARANGADRAAE